VKQVTSNSWYSLSALALLFASLAASPIGGQVGQPMSWDGVCPTGLTVSGGTREWADACQAMSMARLAKSWNPLRPFTDEEIGPPAYGGGLRWSPQQMAQRKANEDALGSPRQPNETQIQQMMQRVKGTIHVNGWQARRVDDQIFLVTFSYSNASETLGWAFEVNLPANLVRLVEGDPELQRKYGLKR
jgi:hypothetical protein